MAGQSPGYQAHPFAPGRNCGFAICGLHHPGLGELQEFLSFTLRWLPSEGALGSFRRAWGWLTPILYLIKQGLFFVALYLIIRSLQLDLLAFALGVMTFQGYRLVLMLFSPERYLQSVFGASIGR
jgi:hypothetical protein